MHCPDVIEVQNTPEEHSATLDSQPDSSSLEQSHSATALAPLIPEDATPEMVFQSVSESNTVRIPACLQVAPVLDGTGIEGEDPEDLTQHLWKDHQKLTATRSALKVYLRRHHGSLDLVMTTRLNAMLHTLNFYLDEGDSMGWRHASQMAAKAAGHGVSLARKA